MSYVSLYRGRFQLLLQSNTVAFFLTNYVKYSLLQDSGGRLSGFRVLHMKIKCSRVCICL